MPWTIISAVGAASQLHCSLHRYAITLMHVSPETIPIYRHICITPLNFDCDTDQVGRQLCLIILLPRAEPAVKDTRCQKSQSETRHDFVHSRCCCLPTSPHVQAQASKPSLLPLRTLDDTTPTLTPYTLRNTAFAFIPLVTTTLLQPKNCNRIHTDQKTRLLILRRAHPRDLRVTTSTTPPTLGRKACHPSPPTIFAPDSASTGSPLLAAAHSHKHVLFRVAVGQDRPVGACLAGFQLGAQTHKAECVAVGSRK